MSSPRRCAVNAVLVAAGVVLWFLATRGWDEYGLWLAPTTAIVMSVAQLIFWTGIAPRRDRG